MEEESGVEKTPVYLRLYDISNGKAATWSYLVLRRKIKGIWHTGIHVFGFEYFYGGGINCMTSSQVESSFQMEIVETRLLGYTTKSRSDFEGYFLQLYDKFTPETYDLVKWNCNHFSDTCAKYLLNKGIPDEILNLPQIVSSTFIGHVALKVFQRVTQGNNPAVFSPDDPNHPRHEFFSANQKENRPIDGWRNLVTVNQEHKQVLSQEDSTTDSSDNPEKNNQDKSPINGGVSVPSPLRGNESCAPKCNDTSISQTKKEQLPVCMTPRSCMQNRLHSPLSTKGNERPFLKPCELYASSRMSQGRSDTDSAQLSQDEWQRRRRRRQSIHTMQRFSGQDKYNNEGSLLRDESSSNHCDDSALRREYMRKNIQSSTPHNHDHLLPPSRADAFAKSDSDKSRVKGYSTDDLLTAKQPRIPALQINTINFELSRLKDLCTGQSESNGQFQHGSFSNVYGNSPKQIQSSRYPKTLISTPERTSLLSSARRSSMYQSTSSHPTSRGSHEESTLNLTKMPPLPPIRPMIDAQRKTSCYPKMDRPLLKVDALPKDLKLNTPESARQSQSARSRRLSCTYQSARGDSPRATVEQTSIEQPSARRVTKKEPICEWKPFELFSAPTQFHHSSRPYIYCPECGTASKTTDLMCRNCGFDLMLMSSCALVSR